MTLTHRIYYPLAEAFLKSTALGNVAHEKIVNVIGRDENEWLNEFHSRGVNVSSPSFYMGRNLLHAVAETLPEDSPVLETVHRLYGAEFVKGISYQRFMQGVLDTLDGKPLNSHTEHALKILNEHFYGLIGFDQYIDKHIENLKSIQKSDYNPFSDERPWARTRVETLDWGTNYVHQDGNKIEVYRVTGRDAIQGQIETLRMIVANRPRLRPLDALPLPADNKSDGLHM